MSIKRRNYSKENSVYWDREIFHSRSVRKRRIEREIELAHETHQADKCSNVNYDEMSVQDIKQILKQKGVSTKLRKKDKLIDLLKSVLD